MKDRTTNKKRFTVLVLILICIVIPLIAGCAHADAAPDSHPTCTGTASAELQTGKQ